MEKKELRKPPVPATLKRDTHIHGIYTEAWVQPAMIWTRCKSPGMLGGMGVASSVAVP